MPSALSLACMAKQRVPRHLIDSYAERVHPMMTWEEMVLLAYDVLEQAGLPWTAKIGGEQLINAWRRECGT